MSVTSEDWSVNEDGEVCRDIYCEGAGIIPTEIRTGYAIPAGRYTPLPVGTVVMVQIIGPRQVTVDLLAPMRPEGG